MAQPDTARVRQLYARRWDALRQERSSWDAHWREISEYLLPRSGRFLVSDRNKGGRRHRAIYDSTGTRALRTLAAGMMGGMTSPARPWFRLTTADADLAKSAAVKAWLSDVTARMRDVFARSNTYLALHAIYTELGAFGTAASLIAPDPGTVLHHVPLTAGGYAIATDWRGNVVTLFREFQQTVGELVGEFGIDNVSSAARRLHETGALDKPVSVVHAIEPRSDRDPRRAGNQNMPWRSVYFEPGEDSGRVLRDSGFENFPALCPRWEIVGGDIYGQSPAMEALGDVKQLQHAQLRKSEGIDYMTKPPLQMPSVLKNQEVDSLPGGVAYVDSAGAQAAIRTQFDVRLDLSHLLADIQDVRQRINSAFYADLFLMLATQPVARMTATEVAERHEEKLLMLGPVLERLQNEMLDPLVGQAFEGMLQMGVLPPLPPEMQGVPLNVEYVSMLAQAQQAVGTNSVDRFVLTLGQVAQLKPDVLDKLDADHWADSYADALGVDPRLILAGDKVALIRQERAQAQAAANAQAQAAQGAQTAHTLSQTDPGAVQDAVAMFSGYTDTGGLAA